MGTVRITKSVKTILAIFEQSEEALSSVDLVNRLRDEMNKTTVYRILERLEEANMLHSFTGKDGIKWFGKEKPNTTASYHPHFQCQTCGKMECLDIQLTVPHLPNYEVDKVKLLLIGKCEDCK